MPDASETATVNVSEPVAFGSDRLTPIAAVWPWIRLSAPCADRTGVSGVVVTAIVCGAAALPKLSVAVTVIVSSSGEGSKSVKVVKSAFT